MLTADAQARADQPEEEPPGWLLDSLPASSLGEPALFDRLVALERQLARVAAEQVKVLAAIHAADTSQKRWSQDAVSLALGLTGRAAQQKLATAATLVTELPRTLAALADGERPARHADLIAEASWRVLPDVTAAFETQVLARAAGQTTPRLRQSMHRAAIRVDPATAEHRRVTAHADRAVTRHALPDGLAELRLTHTADAIEAAWTRLDAGARLLPTADHRSRDQQRADLLIDAVLTGLPLEALPTAQGRRPTIQVVIAASTLLG